MEQNGKEWKNEKFPKPIGVREAKILLKRLIQKVEGGCYVTLRSIKHEVIGDPFGKKTYDSLDSVDMDTCINDLDGIVTRTSDSADIQYKFYYPDEGRTRVRYKGIWFGSHDDQWDTIGQRRQNLVADIKRVIQGYFETRK